MAVILSTSRRWLFSLIAMLTIAQPRFWSASGDDLTHCYPFNSPFDGGQLCTTLFDCDACDESIDECRGCKSCKATYSPIQPFCSCDVCDDGCSMEYKCGMIPTASGFYARVTSSGCDDRRCCKDPDCESSFKGLTFSGGASENVGAIAGIVAGGVAFVVIVACILVYVCRRKSTASDDQRVGPDSKGGIGENNDEV